MNRKRLGFAAVVLVAMVLTAPEQARAAEVTLQDQKLIVAFDSASGALTRLEDKSTHWTIERRPELGISFRLHAPLPNRRYNFVLGSKQHATEVKKIAENQVRIQWKNLLSEHGGILPMTFTATVTLENGALTFNGKLVNDSSLTVETLEYPYFGDVNPPAADSHMHARTMWYGNLQSEEIYPDFRNDKGYWGVFYPMKTFESYRSLFCLIQSDRQGLY